MQSLVLGFVVLIVKLTVLSNLLFIKSMTCTTMMVLQTTVKHSLSIILINPFKNFQHFRNNGNLDMILPEVKAVVVLNLTPFK